MWYCSDQLVHFTIIHLASGYSPLFHLGLLLPFALTPDRIFLDLNNLNSSILIFLIVYYLVLWCAKHAKKFEQSCVSLRLFFPCSSPLLPAPSQNPMFPTLLQVLAGVVGACVLLAVIAYVRFRIAVSKPLLGLPSLRPSFPLGKFSQKVYLHLLGVELGPLELAILKAARAAVPSQDYSMMVLTSHSLCSTCR